jgi:hypothetical protein
MAPYRPSEKMNQPLYYPIKATQDGRKSLINIILEEIRAGRIEAFSAMDSNLPTTYDDIEVNMGATTKTQSIQINAEGQTRNTTITEQSKPEEVKQILVYEEWYFDKKLSKLDVRIIGLMPYWMGNDNDAGRALRKPLFWIRYDDIRDALAKHEVFMANNEHRGSPSTTSSCREGSEALFSDSQMCLTTGRSTNIQWERQRFMKLKGSRTNCSILNTTCGSFNSLSQRKRAAAAALFLFHFHRLLILLTGSILHILKKVFYVLFFFLFYNEQDIFRIHIQ